VTLHPDNGHQYLNIRKTIYSGDSMRKQLSEEQIEEAMKKAQERREKRKDQCLQCRFHEPQSMPAERRRCVHPEARGTISKGDSCLYFKRRWPEGIEPFELEWW